MSILLLGGTADARKLANVLIKKNIPLVYSVAGLVRQPELDCPVISGGFTQYGGLENYLISEKIKVVLDVTHPYAVRMKSKAVEASNCTGIPCWQFYRPEWKPESDDNWQLFDRWESLLPVLSDKQHIFFTVGQLVQQQMNQLKTVIEGRTKHHLFRTAVKPAISLLKNMQWQKAIGPFKSDDELVLMKHYQIDALVTKNSGGQSTIAKINAARLLNIPVLMLKRPKRVTANQVFNDMVSYQQYIVEQWQHLK